MVSELVRQVMTVALGCVVATFAVGGLAACANNDEQAIRAGITKELDAFKNPTQASLSSVIDKDNASIGEIRNMGIDPYEFLARCFKGFDYEIRVVKVSDKTGTVQLHVKNKDLSKAIEYANQQAQTPENLSTLVEINSAEGQNGMVKKYVEWFYAGIDATSDVAEKDVTLKVTKGDDGTWTVDEDSIKELVTATYGGMSLGE